MPKLDELFEDKEGEMVIFASREHPVEFFFQGDYDTWTNVIFNHPEIESFAYVYKDTLTKAFLTTKIIDFKMSKGNQVVVVDGNFSEFVPFTVIENLLFSNSLHYNMGELDDNIPSGKQGSG